MLPILVWDKDSRPFWKMFPLPSNLNLRRHSFLFICFTLVIIGYLLPAETEGSWWKVGLPVATKDGFSMFRCMYVVIVTVVLLIWRLHFSWHTYNGSLNWVKFCYTISIACRASGLTPTRLGLHRFLAISSASWPFLDSNSINATRNCLFRETCIIGLTVEINCINPNTKWRTVVFSLSENFSPNRNHVAAIRPIGKMKNSKIITIIKVVDFKAFFSPLNLALASSETWQARIRFSWRLASLYTRTWRQMIELNNAIVTTVTGIIVALDKKK